MKTDLDKIREDIDQVDVELTVLLERRFELVRHVAEFKSEQDLPILDKDRELRLLAKIEAQIRNPELSGYIIDVYKQILKNSRDFQANLLL